MPENNLSAKAYRALEELLVTLQLEPGKTYSEKELMAISNISRTPLREALLKFSNESLVKIIPRRGIEISDINMTNQLAILETRRVLDTLLLKRAAEFATPNEKKIIKAFKAQMQEAVDERDVAKYLRIDKKLDQTIFDSARNEFATKATSPLHVRSRRFWFYFKGLDDLESSAKLHMNMIDAVVASNMEDSIKYSGLIIDNLIEVVEKYIGMHNVRVKI